MDYQVFCEWLIDEKNMSQRAAHDVISRCRRICKLTGDEVISDTSLNRLLLVETFQNGSMFIKSQLKRAISLYLEFMEVR